MSAATLNGAPPAANAYNPFAGKATRAGGFLRPLPGRHPPGPPGR
jgi:hypothetical protein